MNYTTVFPGVEVSAPDAGLRLGHIYELEGRPYECVLVNECRAKLRPVKAKVETFYDSRTGSYRSIKTRIQVEVAPGSPLKEVTV